MRALLRRIASRSVALDLTEVIVSKFRGISHVQPCDWRHRRLFARRVPWSRNAVCTVCCMSRRCALLLVDVINALDFEGSEPLVAAALDAAPRIVRLAERARQNEVPVIYVNDNFGQWRSDFRATLQACTAADKPGRAVSSQLAPHETDYFVLKPKHSAFYATPLELLLQSLRIETLVLTGFAANVCVLFSANDAHMRGYSVWVPEDCTAGVTPQLTQHALSHVTHGLHGETRGSDQLHFSAGCLQKP
jgi:nicotinamidase-related amidase